MNIALQIAYHMGFSEIVLIGVDLGMVNIKRKKTQIILIRITIKSI